MSFELFQHQEKAVDFIISRGGTGCLYMEMGTGKTLCGIEIFKRLREFESKLRMLVICPLSLIESAWHEDIEKFAPDLKFQNLRKKRKEFWGDILALNYEMARRADFPALVSYLKSEGPLLCFLDESSRIKGYRTQTTQKILNCKQHFKYRICASGTPAPNNEMEYWPQVNFICSTIFPANFFLFRIQYFCLKRREQVVDLKSIQSRMYADFLRQGYKYQLKESLRQIFETKVNEVSFTCRIDTCMDLPERIEKRYEIDMNIEQRSYYKDMESHMITEINGHDVQVSVALSKLLKLRQISSGFIYDDEKSLELPNPKLAELSNLLDDIGDNQVIIWYNFKKEREDIAKVMESKLWASLDGDDGKRIFAVKSFMEGGRQYLVANPASAGHGLTFTRCHHQIFYSLNYSYELFAQAKARTHRAGQKHSTVYHYLLMNNSIEPIILKVLQNKGDKQDILKEFLCDSGKGRPTSQEFKHHIA